MEGKEKFGFLRLAKKSLAVVTASLTSLLGNHSKATSVYSNTVGTDRNLNYEQFQKRVIIPKLVLKLNVKNPENNFLVMHTSHRSHSSHSSHTSYSPPPGHYSHTSHNSHTSHYSSTPSYTPSTPAYTPSNPSPSYNPSSPSSISTYQSSDSSSSSSVSYPIDTLEYFKLGSRVISGGCQGTDVAEMQQFLVNLGYEVDVTGIYDSKTYIALLQFQAKNDLDADGRAGSKTINLLKAKQK